MTSQPDSQSQSDLTFLTFEDNDNEVNTQLPFPSQLQHQSQTIDDTTDLQSTQTNHKITQSQLPFMNARSILSQSQLHFNDQTQSQTYDHIQKEDDEDTDDDALQFQSFDDKTQPPSNTPSSPIIPPTTTPYNISTLPKHACAYCGIHDPSCVVRCDSCDKWFCNSRSNTSGTHIIHHLIRSKHKKISLYKHSQCGETILECYNCSNRNIFVLGFVPADNKGVVVILCREKCLHVQKLKEMEWDGTLWQPLITEREILPWLVRHSTPLQMSRARMMNTEQMISMEELWKSDPTATFTDITHVIQEQISHVLITYEDAQHFQRIYEPLVTLEADYDKQMKESQAQENIDVKWMISAGNKTCVKFSLKRLNGVESELRVVVGDELCIRYPSTNASNSMISSLLESAAYDAKLMHDSYRSNSEVGCWSCNGMVTCIDLMSEEITLELKQRSMVGDIPHHCTCDFRVEFVWKSTSFDRQKMAMKTLIDDDYSVTAYLYHLLMGHEVVPQSIEAVLPDKYHVEGLPRLNGSQSNAIKHCLQQPLSLIQGPPGTGKTVTSASLAYHLTKQNEGQVLVTAPSNIAVDQLTMKIHQTGLKVVRLSAKSREAVSSSVDFLCLHNLVIQVARIQNNELYKWYKLRLEMGDLTRKDNKRYRRLVHETEQKLLKSADVICCTCVGAGDPRLKDFRFKLALIDESTQATETECLIPIVMGAKQIVLVGDHCQLGPVIMCKKAARAGLQRSLFERLILLNIKPIRLQVQYRMHPCLSEFPSNTFYEGTLQNGVTKLDRTEELLKPFWPNFHSPMFFYSSIGREEFSSSGTSYLNRLEAQNVEKLVTRLLKLAIKPDQIGIVTPYEGQRQYISSFMQRKGTLKATIYETIEVASVDAFQGREKDFIILSCVRSNRNQGIGFLNDPRRLNVALTRAKLGLIIVGNPTVLSRQSLWHNLLVHFKKNGLLVDGPLENLKRSSTQLSRVSIQRGHKKRTQNVIPRTFGDHIPPRKRRFNMGYTHHNLSFGTSHLPFSQTSAATQQLSQPPFSTADQSQTDHNSQLTSYAYPGMITSTDLMTTGTSATAIADINTNTNNAKNSNPLSPSQLEFMMQFSAQQQMQQRLLIEQQQQVLDAAMKKIQKTKEVEEKQQLLNVNDNRRVNLHDKPIPETMETFNNNSTEVSDIYLKNKKPKKKKKKNKTKKSVDILEINEDMMDESQDIFSPISSMMIPASLNIPSQTQDLHMQFAMLGLSQDVHFQEAVADIHHGSKKSDKHF